METIVTKKVSIVLLSSLSKNEGKNSTKGAGIVPEIRI